MQLVDFSQVSISAITADAGYGGGPAVKLDEGYVRHLIINMLRSYRLKYGRDYGDLVICCDSKDGYWRKDFWPYYKANRKKDREDSKLDWDTVFYCLDLVKSELKEYFPYPVIEVSKAEGDDVIAVLAEWSQENDLQEDGMWSGEPKNLLIHSADGDQVQNQRFPNVKQYSHMQKKWLTPPAGMSVEQFINEHIAEGDGTDGICNVLSADNCLVDKIRQKSLKKDRRADFIARGYEACLTEEEQQYFKRNQTLVDFRFIPTDLKANIITEFTQQKAEADARGRRKIMNYLIKNRMSLLIDHLSEF